MKRPATALLLFALAVGAALLLLALPELNRLFSLETLAAQRQAITAYRHEHPLRAALWFCAIYVAFSALALPGAVALTLLGGAVFGPLQGAVLSCLAATGGACLAFLLVRHLLRAPLKRRYGGPLQKIDARMRRDGAWYLLALRLVPVVPFFLVNLAMGIGPMRLRVFAAVSLIGMLPGAFLYANAGRQLATLRTPADALSPETILALTLIGLFLLLGRLLRRKLH